MNKTALISDTILTFRDTTCTREEVIKYFMKRSRELPTKQELLYMFYRLELTTPKDLIYQILK
jgi:hypothetical protein